MSKITDFRIGKGRTARPAEAEEWVKKYLELTIKLPEQYTEKDFHEALIRAEYIIDNFLEQDEVPQIPQVNPEELMKHEWKGKKTGENAWEKGSPAWGWDFRDKFSAEIIKVLEKGPLTIDQYEFTLKDAIVQAKKSAKKEKA
jgi:hypothetical protein